MTNKNLLLLLLSARLENPEKFKPGNSFLKAVGISQERFDDLMNGMSPISGKEYKNIAECLGISPKEASETRQLYLCWGETTKAEEKGI